LALAQSIVSHPTRVETPQVRTEGEGLSDSGVGLLNGSPSQSTESSEHETWDNKSQETIQRKDKCSELPRIEIKITEDPLSNNNSCLKNNELKEVDVKSQVNSEINGHFKDENNEDVNTPVTNGNSVICKDNTENVPERRVRYFPYN
jgi:hypothetical protein